MASKSGKVPSWRLVRIGCALTLSVGTGLLAISIALGQQAGTAPPILVGVGGSFYVAYLLLQKNPDIETRVLWRFGGLVFVLFILGNVVSTNGIYAPMGEESPLVIGGLWLLSLGLAYVVMFRHRHISFKQ